MTRAKTPYQLCAADLRSRGLLMPSACKWANVSAIVAPTVEDPDDTLETAAEVLGRLRAHKDVLTVRLVDGKETFVHRKLWPDLFAMATCGAPWQIAWLPRRETQLLELVDTAGRVVVDAELVRRFDATPGKFGRELVARLLVLTSVEHEEPGPEKRILTSWWTWADEARVAPELDPDAARERIEAAALALGPKARLPWFTSGVRRRY